MDPDLQKLDDATIKDDFTIWRRIPPWHVVPDRNRGSVRPSSAAFEDPDDGTSMSVFLAYIVFNSGREAKSVLAGHDDYGLATFTAFLARQKGQAIVRRPLPDEPAHAEVVGKKTGSVRRALARNCEWLIPPPSLPQSQ